VAALQRWLLRLLQCSRFVGAEPRHIPALRIASWVRSPPMHWEREDDCVMRRLVESLRVTSQLWGVQGKAVRDWPCGPSLASQDRPLGSSAR